eukprot:TRINITY_DN4691_c0_g1_i9.p1 TRINITY_DN4691_c0_g1~~TRINITY_DN4691_c0_g1_i9.p1  ORF type:complete len:456 (+),score=214.30 TRINITY_DN4691_c0_g1_i9:65-1432(+)
MCIRDRYMGKAMFSWFKKKKPEEKKQEPPRTASPAQKQTAGPKREDEWIYEYILQYLTSPLWRFQIFGFVDENCVVFDTDEENKFAYTEIHNKFKKLIEQLLEDLLRDLGITQEQFLTTVEAGLANPAHKKIFEQLVIVENFLVFKKLMVKRNKELELEAMRALEQAERQQQAADYEGRNFQDEKDPEVRRILMEKEKAEIEHAIAMSIAIEEERRRALDDEDKELQEAMRLSQQEYQEGELRKKQSEEEELQRIAREVAARDAQLKRLEQRRQQEEQAKMVETPAQPAPPAEQAPVQEAPVQEAPKAVVQEETKEQPAPKKVAELAPLKKREPLQALQPVPKYEDKTIDELLKQRESLFKKIQETEPVSEKKEEAAGQKESPEERKKRLLAQRDLILKRKKEEREAELKKYNEEIAANPQAKLAPTSSKPAFDVMGTNEGADERAAIYEKFKQL